MFLTAFMAIPLSGMALTVVEVSSTVALKNNLQYAADEAVLGVLSRPELRWRQAQRFGRTMFLANYRGSERVKSIRMRMQRKVRSGKFQLHYEVTARTESLFGDVTPFGKQNVTVKSAAEIDRRNGGRARLIAPETKTGTFQR